MKFAFRNAGVDARNVGYKNTPKSTKPSKTSTPPSRKLAGSQSLREKRSDLSRCMRFRGVTQVFAFDSIFSLPVF